MISEVSLGGHWRAPWRDPAPKSTHEDFFSYNDTKNERSKVDFGAGAGGGENSSRRRSRMMSPKTELP